MPLSGLGDGLALAPLGSEYHGPGWRTGGVFDPEDSVLTIAMISIRLAGMFRFAKTRDRVKAGRSARAAATASADEARRA